MPGARPTPEKCASISNTGAQVVTRPEEPWRSAMLLRKSGGHLAADAQERGIAKRPP